MFHLMAYNKDQDRYDEWQSGMLQEVQAEALFCRDLLRSDDLRDASGDLYDWMEYGVMMAQETSSPQSIYIRHV